MPHKYQNVWIVFLLTVAFTSSAQEQRLRRELAHVPQPVRKTIRAHLEGGGLVSVDKDEEDGDLTYDVDIMRNGKERSFTVGASGELVDEEVFLDELPPHVRLTVQKHLGAATLGEIDKSMDDGETSYDVEITRNGQDGGFTVDDNGALVEEQVFLNELPVAVRQTIQTQTAGAAISEIDKSMDDGKPFYSVEATNGDKTQNFTVGDRGDLIDVEVTLADLPAAVQTAVQKETRGNVDAIEKCFDDGEVSYDVDVSGAKPCTLSFDADGELFGREEDIELSAAPEAVQAQINALLGGGKLLGLSKETDDGTVSYEADLGRPDGAKTVVLDLAGKIVPDDQ